MSTLEALARGAVEGDRTAMRALLEALQDDVHGLALRMLWNREDAEDATQEILLRVITRLSRFDGRSALKTWVYRVATNYLLDVKKSAVEQMRLRFDTYADDLTTGLSDDGPAEHEHSVLVEEVKIGCLMGMLQCLDRPHRLAYILGEILELSAPDAALALDVTPAAFRKRLERARRSIETFTRTHCGLLSDDAPCRCHRRVPVALAHGRASAVAPLLASRSSSFADARDEVRNYEASRRSLELFRIAEPRHSDVDFARELLAALDSP
jgi:RNA polymerase sigma factor (sigma-70 family)